MSSVNFELADLERVCKLAKEFGLKSFKNGDVVIEFFPTAQAMQPLQQKHLMNEPSEEELLMNPMAGLPNV